MVTHDLVLRGLAFDDAYAAAQALRDRLAGRDEVSSEELERLLRTELERLLPAERLARLDRTPAPGSTLRVVLGSGAEQPFSRGLLARSLTAAGVDFDQAYALVGELQAELQREQIERLETGDLESRIGALLEERVGSETAGRYRLLGRIEQLPKPLVIYLGGASGTGKSTLAVELAPLLQIYRVNATDTVRQVMRMVFARPILPGLHRSSFDPPDHGRRRSRTKRVLEHFDEQSRRVCVGVRALVERAITERMNILVEGVHLIPPFVPFADLDEHVIQVPLLLTALDEENHRSRFVQRGTAKRRAERYHTHFDDIREIQNHLLVQAEERDVPILDTDEVSTTLVRALRVVTSELERRLPHLTAPL